MEFPLVFRLLDLAWSLIDGYVITYTGLRLLGVPFCRRRHLAVGLFIGLAIALSSELSRRLVFPLGTHQLVALVAMLLISRFGLGIRWAVAVGAVFAGMIVYSFGSLLVGGAIVLFALDLSFVINNPAFYAGLGLLERLPLFVTYLLVIRKGIVLLDAGAGSPRSVRTLYLLDVVLIQTYGLVFLGVFTTVSRHPLWDALPVGIPRFFFWFLVTALPVGGLFFIRELDRLAEAEVKLERAERLAAVGELAAHLAHEVRNPVTAIKGYINLNHRRADAEAAGADRRDATYLKLALDEVRQVEHLLSEFLMLGRLEEDKTEPVDLAALTREVAAGLEQRAAESGVGIAVSVPAEPPPPLQGNPHRLRQVIANLIVNAIESGPADSRVGVVCARDGNRLKLSVSDTGVGISPAEVENIFAPFYTTKELGTGLGLAVVQRIVHDHGGIIEVESTPGRGSTFSIYLPITPGRR